MPEEMTREEIERWTRAHCDPAKLLDGELAIAEQIVRARAEYERDAFNRSSAYQKLLLKQIKRRREAANGGN